ncbi:MAG: hypothetical protein M0R66_03855 [Candidatus Omnitrophica bacterium]|nr:hypothetical protein [Candidatus Omnitrophota bacterium]
MKLNLDVPIGTTVGRLTISKGWDKYEERLVDLKKVDFGDPSRSWLFQLAWTCPFCSFKVETGCADRAADGEYEEECRGCGAKVVLHRCPTCKRRIYEWKDRCDECSKPPSLQEAVK